MKRTTGLPTIKAQAELHVEEGREISGKTSNHDPIWANRKMRSILILVSADDDKPLQEDHLNTAVSTFGLRCRKKTWLAPGKAGELYFDGTPTTAARRELEALLGPDRIDALVVADDDRRRKKLLISDMDSTIVVGETLDDLAAACGLKEEVAKITDLAMRGELDFQGALATRVAMLAGLQESAILETAENVQYMAGAETLVKTMRRHGAQCVLVSGGFTTFTELVAGNLGFHASHGNTLEIENGLLTGKVHNPILNHQSKLELLQQYVFNLDLDPQDSMAIGDGANDLAMLSAAGLGVGFHPKPYLRERVDNNILYGDLTVLLYAQGYCDF